MAEPSVESVLEGTRGGGRNPVRQRVGGEKSFEARSAKIRGGEKGLTTKTLRPGARSSENGA